MDHFHYKHGNLYCEDVLLESIAKRYGTPFYCYSTATLQRHYHSIDQPFAGMPHLICYAMKANSNIAILKLLTNLGAGVDIVSGGELFRAQQALVDSKKIVFSGVGKTRTEIEAALDAEILHFNIESEQELLVIHQVAKEKKKLAAISFRVNPDVDPKTHPYISTGLKESKFGVPYEQAVSLYQKAKSLDFIRISGIDCHIGSQLIDTAPFVDALKRIIELMKILEGNGIRLEYLDLGGGLGITYNQELPPHPAKYGHEIITALKTFYSKPITLIFEPGRVIVGNAGVLVFKTLYVKYNKKKFIIVDAAMNDTIRPALYQSYHQILHVNENVEKHGPRENADVVGPICESGDFLARDRDLPLFQPDELGVLRSAGAYGFSMSSNYNSRPRIPEILVNGKEFFCIRKRETYEDLIRGEEIPDFLK